MRFCFKLLANLQHFLICTVSLSVQHPLAGCVILCNALIFLWKYLFLIYTHFFRNATTVQNERWVYALIQELWFRKIAFSMNVKSVESINIITANPWANRQLGTLEIGRRIILKIMRNEMWKCGLDSAGSKQNNFENTVMNLCAP